jgi:hypothetical protein
MKEMSAIEMVDSQRLFPAKTISEKQFCRFCDSQLTKTSEGVYAACKNDCFKKYRAYNEKYEAVKYSEDKETKKVNRIVLDSAVYITHRENQKLKKIENKIIEWKSQENIDSWLFQIRR